MDGPGTSRRQGTQDLPGRIRICGGTSIWVPPLSSSTVSVELIR
jgi:hypothetical protein